MMINHIAGAPLMGAGGVVFLQRGWDPVMPSSWGLGSPTPIQIILSSSSISDSRCGRPVRTIGRLGLILRMGIPIHLSRRACARRVMRVRARPKITNNNNFAMRSSFPPSSEGGRGV